MYCSILPTHDRRALSLSDSSLHVYHMFMSLYAKQLRCIRFRYTKVYIDKFLMILRILSILTIQYIKLMRKCERMKLLIILINYCTEFIFLEVVVCITLHLPN